MRASYSYTMELPPGIGLMTSGDHGLIDAMAALFQDTPNEPPTQWHFDWLVHLGECFNTEPGDLYPTSPYR